jgi:DNA mismatch endonuclease (patch repair protein)
MTDVFTPEKRSKIMSRIRGKDTNPEKKVRSVLHRMGYRFRLHRKDLPGNPDIILPKFKKAIFVHGCFWHQHPGCKRAALPSSNREFWKNKLQGNRERDLKKIDSLKKDGWDVLIIWQCEIKSEDNLAHKLKDFISVAGVGS